MKFTELTEQYHDVILNEKKFKVSPGNELKFFKGRVQQTISAAEKAQEEAYAYNQMVKELPHADALAGEVADWLKSKGFVVDDVQYRLIDPISDEPAVSYEFNFKSAGDAKVDKEFDMEYDAFLLSKGYGEGHRGRSQRVVIIPVDIS